MICDKCSNCLIQEHSALFSMRKTFKSMHCLITKEDIVKEPLFCNKFDEIIINKEKSIAVKTPAIIIDELFTVLHKCWNQQEIIMDSSNSSEIIAQASIKAQELNAKRNKLIRALDEILEFDAVTLTEKTYCKDK